MRELTLNSIQCLHCYKVLVSKHRHDFVECGCDNQTFVDGGNTYQRVGGKDLSLIRDLSLHELVLESSFCSRKEFLSQYNVKEFFEGYNNFCRAYNTACISLVTTEEERFPFYKDWKDTIQLVCKDDEYNLTTEQAKGLVSFIKEQVLTKKSIITHCDMGISRSAAVDLFIQEVVLGYQVEDISKTKWCNYNRQLFNKLSYIYYGIENS